MSYRFLSLLLIASPLSAQTFSEPLAVKVGWDAQALYLGDVDRDGREDMAIINNDRARIVFRYGLKPGEKADGKEVSIQEDRWEHIVENAPFQKRWLTTGLTAYDLHFTDLNGDQKPDLIYTTDRDELYIHFQLPKREWAEPEVIKLRELKNNWTTIASGDLDGDGDNDISILGASAVAVLKNEKGVFEKPSYYPCGKSNYNLQIQDLNGDQKLDITYQDPDAKDVYLRLQQDGDFPVEQLLGIQEPGTMIRFDGKTGDIIARSSETLALEYYELKQAKNDLSKGEVGIFSYSLGDAKASALSHVRADVNQDGTIDLVIADENSAELRVYLLQKNGRFSPPVISATVSGIQTLKVADLIPGGNLECIVFSKEENIIGLSTVTGDGVVPFPTQIPLAEEAFDFTTVDLEENGNTELIYLSENHLHFVWWQEGKWVSDTTEFEELGQDSLVEMRVFDIDQDGRKDLLLLDRRKPLKILLQQENARFELSDEQSGFAEKLTNRLAASAISGGDVDGDGKEELLLCRETFARAVKLGADGQLQVVQQVNLKQKNISLRGVQTANLLGDEAPEFLFYEKKEGRLEIADALGESLASIELGLGDFASLELGEEDIFVFGEEQVLRLPLNQKLIQAQRLHSYQTSLKDVNYIDFRIGDLNGDGKVDAVAIDSTESHVLEVLLGTDEGWKSQQHFVIYEADRHYRGKRGSDFQPHDFHLHDVNNDGKKDLVLHIHDRVLSYLQQ